MNVVFSYSRQEAIKDGVLVDVSATAAEAGYRFPVALTSAVWAAYVEVPEGLKCQGESGRLWDILWMLRFAISQDAGGSEIRFIVLVKNDDRAPQPVELKAVCGPGDTAEPVVTVMKLDCLWMSLGVTGSGILSLLISIRRTSTCFWMNS